MSKKIITIGILLILLSSSMLVLSQPVKSQINVNYKNYSISKNYQNYNSSDSSINPWNINAKPCIEYFPSGSYPAEEPPFFAYQIRQAYNITPLENKGYMGQGMSVAIVDAFGDPYLNYDISSFNAYEGLPSLNISFVYPYSLPSTYNLSWAIETATDVEWFHAIAPYAKIYLVIVPNASVGYLQAGINYTIQNLSVNEISLSWGIPETELGQSLVDVYNGVFRIAAEKGIGVFAASGDGGAFDGKSTPTVNFPAADPFVTSVGGTSLYLLDGKYGQYAWSGSGGGYSVYFNSPNYQVAPGFSAPKLGVPDMSMDANPNEGGVRVFAGAGCYVIGGTSLATPMSAASAILISQYLHKNLGFFAPYLYRIANTDQYGKAIVPVSGGSNGFYKANSQWNPVTGLGSLNVARLSIDIKKLIGKYGADAYYGMLKNGNFSISSSLNISMNSLAQNETEQTGIGIYSNVTHSQIISAGFRENKTGVYFYSRVGNNYSFVPVNHQNGYLNNTVYVFLNITNLRIVDGKISMTYSIFPYDIYGSIYDSFLHLYTGNSTLPEGINSTIFNYQVVTGGTRLNQSGSVGNFSIAPFYQANLSMVSAKSYHKRTVFYPSNTPSPLAVPNLPNAFTISQTYPLELNFTNKTHFILNGISIYSNNSSLNSGAKYNLKYYWKGNLEEFNITTPYYERQYLGVNYNSSAYFKSNFSGFLDYLYPLEFSGNLDFSRVGLVSNISLSSYGFYEFSGKVTGKESSIQMIEKNVNISLNISPADSKIYLSGQKKIIQYPFRESLTPQNYDLQISSSGFISANASINLTPGNNVVYAPFALQGDGKGYFVNGTITNEFYDALDNLVIPIRNVLIKYNSTDYAYSDVNGQFSIWVPYGQVNLSFSNRYFDKYSYSFNVTKNSQLNITLYPEDKTLSKYPPTVTITRLFPILFFSSYISWATNIGKDIEYFVINYKSSNQNNWTKIMINSNTSTYSFINGIYPWLSYKVMITAELKDNVTINSTVADLSYSDPVYPLLNSLIYLGLFLYIYVIINYFKRRKKRKEMEKSFFEE
ncbi:S53 family peptidase [Cuniculiplasma sp. SKW4]|uniref:S53 family peptidase n=1 Tax=Cuniculiplasma sp. SKW4 TaxID=3400171 RepID=UPI003FCF2004